MSAEKITPNGVPDGEELQIKLVNDLGILSQGWRLHYVLLKHNRSGGEVSMMFNTVNDADYFFNNHEDLVHLKAHIPPGREFRWESNPDKTYIHGPVWNHNDNKPFKNEEK